ncbi:MAG: YceI family protein, partial [Rhodobacterales bacterium]|nr:YceI family protein [Rhodobacterales bacterium]
PAEKAAGAVYPIDSAKSTLDVLGAKATKAFPITIGDFSGELTVDGDQVTGISYEARVASLDAKIDKLTAHLKNADFLEVDAHPTATFVSSQIAAGATEEGATHTVTGVLNIRGKEKQVTFPATITVSETSIDAKTEFAIDRQDFGITIAGMKDDLIQDKVVLTIQAHAEKK